MNILSRSKSYRLGNCLGYSAAVLIAVVMTSACHLQAADDTAPLVEEYLQKGDLAGGHEALTARLKSNPDDQQARFGLGMLQFLQAIEHLGQSHYKYGLLKERGRNIPLLRLPVPENNDPQELTYEAGRDVLKTFLADLEAAEKTLAKIGDADVKMPIHFGLIKLDLDGDGKAANEESLWGIYTRVAMMQAADTPPEEVAKFVIQFDTGDAYWLRGYCHLLMFFGEVGLAHDSKELFERTGHIFWPKTVTPHEFLRNGRKVFEIQADTDIADLIAFVHLLRFPVVEPERMTSAWEHLKGMTDLSRKSWKAILSEKDDVQEWVPNPNQTGVIPNVRVTKEMVEAWHDFLGEMDQILEGKRLLPFWRGNGDQGINFKRVFTEPREFDLVLWIQGTAATPYLEAGSQTDEAVWERLTRVFQGEFIGFAIWFN
ncbi:MAG: hypothetical protein ACKVT0_05900 [Planctomycetaceae bacterium]